MLECVVIQIGVALVLASKLYRLLGCEEDGNLPHSDVEEGGFGCVQRDSVKIHERLCEDCLDPITVTVASAGAGAVPVLVLAFVLVLLLVMHLVPPMWWT